MLLTFPQTSIKTLSAQCFRTSPKAFLIKIKHLFELKKNTKWRFCGTVNITKVIIEPRHDKTNKMNARPAKTHISLELGHPPSLITLFAVRMKKPWVLSNPLSAREDSGQTGWMPRLIWIFAERTVILLVFLCRSSSTSVYIVSVSLQRIFPLSNFLFLWKA